MIVLYRSKCHKIRENDSYFLLQLLSNIISHHIWPSGPGMKLYFFSLWCDKNEKQMLRHRSLFISIKILKSNLIETPCRHSKIIKMQIRGLHRSFKTFGSFLPLSCALQLISFFSSVSFEAVISCSKLAEAVALCKLTYCCPLNHIKNFYSGYGNFAAQSYRKCERSVSFDNNMFIWRLYSPLSLTSSIR